MREFQFVAPCLFGLEGLAGDELRRMDMQNVKVEDRRVLFTGDAAALAKANICLRTGERIMVVLAQFQAKSFEELFQGVYHANLEDYIPKDGQFPEGSLSQQPADERFRLPGHHQKGRFPSVG